MIIQTLCTAFLILIGAWIALYSMHKGRMAEAPGSELGDLFKTVTHQERANGQRPAPVERGI